MSLLRLRIGFSGTSTTCPASNSLGQAGRLWHLGADDCRHVLDALVDAGVLRWTAQRTIVMSHVTVARARR